MRKINFNSAQFKKYNDQNNIYYDELLVELQQPLSTLENLNLRAFWNAAVWLVNPKSYVGKYWLLGRGVPIKTTDKLLAESLADAFGFNKVQIDTVLKSLRTRRQVNYLLESEQAIGGRFFIIANDAFYVA